LFTFGNSIDEAIIIPYLYLEKHSQVQENARK
jgi:hypothetical protein